MGEVFLAEDTTLKRRVALKVLPASFAGDEQRLKRFRREAETVAALNHPNIVTLHSIEESEGLHFLTMELVEGRSLAEVIPRHGLSLDDFFRIAVPLTAALAAAHEKGITHRDLKPGNIMVSDQGLVKVLDFGLAKLDQRIGASREDGADTESLTLEGNIPGTVLYMSPEQLMGRSVDHRSDIFSIGVIFHEMLTGHNAFRRASSAETVTSILREDPPPVTEQKRDLPNHLGRIVQHCLKKDPERRYQSAIDLRNDLEDLEREITAAEISSSGVESKSARPQPSPRRRGLFMVLGLALIVAVIAAAVGYLQSGRSSAQAPEAIAVLPLDNLTGDPNQDYLGEGISAGLITQLSEVVGLRVVGRSETWSYRDENLSLKDLGLALGVEALLEGELQRQEEGFRVDVKLTDARTGLIMWSESFAAGAREIYSLPPVIARRLVDYLSIPLSFKERRRLTRRPTASSKAYDYFLQGQQYLEVPDDPRGIDFAADIFRQAIRADPDFALARVGLSEALWRLYHRDGRVEDLEEAEREARTALEIDPQLAAGQVALARVFRSTGRHAESIAELRQVLASHPKPDEAQRELAASYEQIGDAEGAERSLRAAVALDESYWFNWNNLGTFLARAGRYPEAREAYEHAAKLAPADVFRPLENIGTLYLYEGNFEAAIETYEKLPRPLDGVQATNIGTAYFFAGRMELAEQYFAQAVRLDPGNAELRRNYADALRRLGQESEALQQYREAVGLVDQELALNPANRELVRKRSMYAAKAGDCAAALPPAEELWRTSPPSAEYAHELAFVFALCERRQRALEAIETSIELGFAPELLRQEDEFRSLRDDPEFLRLTRSEPANAP
jgi:serine/threonine protein kinase/tetratricopeptide (TPR) repeat protein